MELANSEVTSTRVSRLPVVLGGLLLLAVIAVLGAAALFPTATAHGDNGPVIQVPTATPTSKPTRTPTPRIPRLAPTATPSPTPATYRRVIPGVSNEALPTPAAPPPRIAPDMSVLQQSLQAAVTRFPVSGAYAIAVTDLQTGSSVDVKGDSYQLSGCIMNIFVLVAAMLDVQGRLLAGRRERDDCSDDLEFEHHHRPHALPQDRGERPWRRCAKGWTPD